MDPGWTQDALLTGCPFSFFLGTTKTFSWRDPFTFSCITSFCIFISFCQLMIFVLWKLQPDLVLFTGMFSYYLPSIYPQYVLHSYCFLSTTIFIHQPSEIGRIIGSLHFILASGDFGNENVDLVRSIADLEMTKAVILGNHDAWNTQNFSGRQVQVPVYPAAYTYFL